MRKFAVPLWSLMLFIILVGVGFSALKTPSLVWTCSIFSFAVGSLLFSTLGALAKQGEERLRYLGYTIFGGGYVGFTYLIHSIYRLPDLPTDYFLTELARILFPTENTVSFDLSYPVHWNSLTPVGVWFYQTGHSLTIILLGLLGSVSAPYFTSKQPSRT